MYVYCLLFVVRGGYKNQNHLTLWYFIYKIINKHTKVSMYRNFCISLQRQNAITKWKYNQNSR